MWKESFRMMHQEIYCYGQELADTQKGLEIYVHSKATLVTTILENLGRKSQALEDKPISDL